MSFPRYPKYKDSGVEWLGEVPEHWRLARVHWLFEIKKRIAGELGYDVLSITQKGIKVKDIDSNDGQLSMDYSKYQLVEPGDFAMNHMDLLTGYIDIASTRGVTSPDYRVFSMRMADTCEDRYFLRLFQAGYDNKIFYAFGQGSSQLGRWRLPTEEFRNLVFPVPPVSEQKCIAAFLDRETARIDALIAEQRRLMELLKEKRQAVISHAVTKGLNPDAPMKNSGIEWLGEVPAHWEIAPVKHLAKTASGGTPSKERLDWWYGDVPWASSKDMKCEELSDTEDHLTTTALEEGAATLAPVGSVFIVVRGMILSHTFPVVVSLTPMAFNQDLKALTAIPRMRQDYLAWMLRGTAKQTLARVDEAAHGTTVLRMDAWGLMPLPVPPLDEQEAIVRFLRDQLASLDSLSLNVEHAIDLLIERRTALISAAVTGQIDVRNVA